MRGKRSGSAGGALVSDRLRSLTLKSLAPTKKCPPPPIHRCRGLDDARGRPRRENQFLLRSALIFTGEGASIDVDGVLSVLGVRHAQPVGRSRPAPTTIDSAATTSSGEPIPPKVTSRCCWTLSAPSREVFPSRRRPLQPMLDRCCEGCPSLVGGTVRRGTRRSRPVDAISPTRHTSVVLHGATRLSEAARARGAGVGHR